MPNQNTTAHAWSSWRIVVLQAACCCAGRTRKASQLNKPRSTDALGQLAVPNAGLPGVNWGKIRFDFNWGAGSW